MSIAIKTERYWIGAATAAAFLLPGVGLWIPSGYSIGTVVLLFAALVSMPFWVPRMRPLGAMGWLAASVAVMGLLWWVDAEAAHFGYRGYEKPFKYLLALPCILFLRVYAPKPAALWTGFAVGGIGAGLIAIYQMGVKHFPRAEGYTNAIQYGDLSLLFGLICLVFLAVRPPEIRWPMRVLLVPGAALGVLGCLMSQSRGGWLALVLVVPVLAVLLSRYLPRRAMVALAIFSVAGVAILVATQSRQVGERLEKAEQEVVLFNKGDTSVTSVSQRLYHWQLAWRMGIEKPLTGWGRQGYVDEKQRRVEAGLVNPSVLEFTHAHNEVMDLFVKHGVPGVLALLFFYGVPLVIFWPTAARMRRRDGSFDRTALSLRMAGLLVPLSTIGFGLTQVFTAHNSGNINYLFLNMLIYASLRGHEQASASQVGPTAPTASAIPAVPAVMAITA